MHYVERLNNGKKPADFPWKLPLTFQYVNKFFSSLDKV